MIKTQLLCTFTTEENLDNTIQSIIKSYKVAFDSIYVLENLEAPGSLCLTYNIDSEYAPQYPLPPSTISLHRKKQTNTLYTINALNKLVQENNNGKLDNKFPVPWDQVKNSILVTTYDQLRRIPTKVKKIVKVSEVSQTYLD
jgi:hypothetical protein